MAVTNTDDHLRNHAFIFTREGWVLSPMYDGIEEKKASEYAERIVSTVKTDWVALAKKYGLTRRQIEEMEPAFRLN